MSGIYPQKKEGGFVSIEPGTYVARCYSMIEIGHVKEEFPGKPPRKVHKVLIGWELPTELAVFAEEKGEQPYVVSKKYTVSLHEKSKLREHLESWRGKPFADDEIGTFNLQNLLGAVCMVTITQRASSDGSRTYPEVKSVVKLMKGQSCPPAVNPKRFLCFEDFDWELFNGLSEKMQELIKSSDEFNHLQEPNIIHDDDTGDEGAIDNDDKLPF